MVGARRVYKSRSVRGEAAALLLCKVVVAAIAAQVLSGCSLALPVASLSSDEETTGSVVPKVVSPLSSDLGEEDWRRAKGAMTVALDPQGNGSAVAWDNPESGMRGSFTPVGQPFVKSDEICRAFLANISGQVSASALQGTACRPSGGEWAIREVKPWRKPA